MRTTFLAIKFLWSIELRALLLFCFLVSFGYAQMPQNVHNYWKWIEAPSTMDPYAFQGEVLSKDGEELQAVTFFLKKTFRELDDPRVDLKPSAFRRSPIGTHYQFEQTFDGRRVLGSEVKVNLRKGRTISTMIVSLVGTRNWGADLMASKTQLSDDTEEIVFFDGEVAQIAWTYEDVNAAQNQFYEVIELSNGVVLRRDAALHSGFEDAVDTTAWVYVYNPDPLTASKRIYGGDFQNFGDEDRDSLTAARELRKLEVKFENDTFWLQNKYAKVFGGINFQVPLALTDTFDFTRSQDEFEYVNSVFHVTQYRKYIATVKGFEDLLDYQIRINARAFLDDNSSFKRTSNSGGQGVMYLGYSSISLEHVDDAEDADVIIHELGHALSYSANQNIPSGVSRESIDEGLGDYLACAYSKRISEHRWENLFSWDGNNPFWEEGRKCFSDVTVDDFSSSKSIYSNGEILAVTLMEVYDKFGGTIADQIIFSSFYEYANKMEFELAGKLLLDAEEELFDGLYHKDLCTILAGRGYVTEKFCGIGFEEVNVQSLKATVLKTQFQQYSQVQINFDVPFRGEVSLYSIDGKLLMTQALSDQSSFQKTVDCLPGVYLLKMDNGKQVQMEKLIKN